MALGALLLASLATLALGEPAIAFLKSRQLRDTIRDVGPASHQSKQGTPTMGGLLMIPVVLVAALILDRGGQELVPLLISLAGFGLLGFADDLSKVARRLGYGFQVRYKFVVHPGFALALALVLYLWLGQHSVDFGPIRNIELGWLYVILAAFAIFGASSEIGRASCRERV